LIELVDAIHMWTLNLQTMYVNKKKAKERTREKGMTNAFDR